MRLTNYWADDYVMKKRTAKAAMKQIRSGQRIFVGSSAGVPRHLVQGLAEASEKHDFTDIEIVHLFSMGADQLTKIAEKSMDDIFTIRSFYSGSAASEDLMKDRRFLTPVNLSQLPRLFKNKSFPLHVALIQVTPPDDFGWMGLGVSLDITLAAALAADFVIARVNPQMPWISGSGFIHVNDVDVIVEHDEELLTIRERKGTEVGNNIARHIARLVDDGSTIQLALGASSESTILALAEKNDIGVHTQFITNGLMHLASLGVITNKRKGFNEGKLVASNALGTQELYEFLNTNPSVDLRPSDYVCDPRIISRHNRMVAINIVDAIDLTGQVAADAHLSNNYSGVGGINDFMKGTALAEGGKSILVVRSTDETGAVSRIRPRLHDTNVAISRTEVHFVVTEYGAVNLLGKSFQDRAMALISIAHPDFRAELFQEAKEMGLISQSRNLGKSLHGVYPLKLEETIYLKGQSVTIRPAKPVDERGIQEHFYGMEEKDVRTRFFHPKKRFLKKRDGNPLSN